VGQRNLPQLLKLEKTPAKANGLRVFFYAGGKQK